VNVEHMLGSIISGALTGKRKRRRGVTKYLTGGKGSLLNASTLLTMAGVAWGLYETATSRQGTAAPVMPSASGPQPASGASPATMPPIPVLPGVAATAAAPSAAPAAPDVPAEVVRLVRLTISAARADGTLTPDEEATILEHARTVGAEAIVQRELKSSFTLAQIATGIPDPRQREEMYLLAFAMVRGDEQVTGGERVYLAQLAHQLGLDATSVARLEADAARAIDAAAGASPDESRSS
jgi:uncharacterized membrane protein YebE (DUF533 family)